MKAKQHFHILLTSVLILLGLSNIGTSAPFTIGRIKYQGGGDWYSDPTSLPNLLKGLQERTTIDAAEKERVLTLTDPDLFLYPMIYITGHGTVRFSDVEMRNLRLFLENGGFLWADDNYGMDKSFRKELGRLFPEKELVELPFTHEIYHSLYEFPNGLPKIHKHDGGPPHGYGMFHDGRLILFYSYNTDIGDGLESAEVHHDPAEKREAALKMAINIIVYVLSH